jgi:transposase-like protein
LAEFLSRFGNEQACWEYLVGQRWPQGFACPKCGYAKGYSLSDGHIECAGCGYQASVTAGTVMHRSHVPLTKWFLAFYLITQDKRGISSVQLSKQLDVTYKTGWYMQMRIRKAMGQRKGKYILSGVVKFDDACFGGEHKGGKRGRGSDKAKVFVALSLDEKGHPKQLAMQVTANLRQASVKKFALAHIQKNSVIHSDALRSYPPALKGEYRLKARRYDPNSETLRWLHIMVSNAKAYILGTYHGLPKQNLQAYLDEFCYRFSRRYCFGQLVDCLARTVATSRC